MTVLLRAIGTFLTSTLGQWLLILSILAGSHFWAYSEGVSTERERQERQDKQDQLVIDMAEYILLTDHDRIVSDLEDKLRQAKDEVPSPKVITKEVIRYVTKKADAMCTLTDGFVRVHDAAIEGRYSTLADSDAGDADTPAKIELSRATEVIAGNGAECKYRGEIITAWQDWYKANEKAYNQFRQSVESGMSSPPT